MRPPLKVRDARRKEVHEPCMVYISGWTEEQYFAEAPEMWFAEFIDGELIVHSPVAVRHQDIVRFLTFLLTAYVDFHKLGKILNGPAVTRLRPGLNLEPDIFFIPAAHIERLATQYFSGAPAFAVEVISQSTRNYDLRLKASYYREHGVLEYWVVDLEGKVLFRHLLPEEPSSPYVVTQYNGGRLESQSVPGFWIEVSWLWAEPLPGELDCLRQFISL